MGAFDFVDMILKEYRKIKHRKIFKKNLSIFYNKQTKVIMTTQNRTLSSNQVGVIKNWIRRNSSCKMGSRIQDNIYQINFDEYIFVFEMFEDDLIVAMSGVIMKKDNVLKYNLLNVKANFVLEGLQ